MQVPQHQVTIKELREFGIIFGVIFVLLFGLFLPWLLEKSYPLWPWYILAVTGGLAIVFPAALKPVYKLWMKFGVVMAWLNTRIILGFVFYFVFMPFGLVMKLFGKDLLSRKLDPDLKTYRVVHQEEKSNMENPF